MSIYWITWVGLAMIAIGTAFTIIGQQKISNKGTKLLQEKNNEIVNLNQQIAYSITGGDSYCYVAFSLPDHDQTKSLITTVHKGKFPLYDVNIRIVDLDKFDKYVKGKEKLTIDDVSATETRISIGGLAPNQAATMGHWDLPQGGEARYNIFITARNGFLTELVRIKRLDSKWVAAYKVTRNTNGTEKILYEKVDKDYPKLNSGQINW